MVSNLTRMGKVGVANEGANWGTAVTTTALLPFTSFNATHNITDQVDEGVRGIPAMDFLAVQGADQGELEIEGWVYPDEIGFFLLAQMGAVASTAATGGGPPSIHSYTLLKNPPSLTFHEQRDALTAFDWSGMLNSSLTLKFTRNDGTLTFNASFAGKNGIAATNDTLTETASTSWGGWEATMSSGTSADTDIMSLEITMERNVTLVHAGNDAQSPSTGYLGPQRVTGTLVANYNSDAKLDKFLNKTQEEVSFVFTNGASTDDERSLTATIPIMDYGAGAATVSRDADHFTIEYPIRGLYDSSSTSVINFTLKNETDSY